MQLPGKIIPQRVTSQKIISRVDNSFFDMYDIPEDHKNVGVMSANYFDIMYCALDDATKKANIKIVDAGIYYGGAAMRWSKNSGSVFSIFSGPNVSDVTSAMNYINEYIETHNFLHSLAEDNSTVYFAGLIPKAGKYFQEMLQVPAGTSLAYLAGPPTDTMFALDKALKAGKTKMGKFWAPPHVNNGAAAIVYGTESACKTSLEAFASAMAYCAENPMAMR